MPARIVRKVVVRQQYRVVRYARPGSALPPPKPPKKGGGGWLVVAGIVGALVVVGKLAGSDVSSGSVMPSTHETGRRVMVESKIEENRCLAPGSVNGVPITFMVDTGAPSVAEFPNSWARELGLGNLDYEELWPGTRYGKIATATVDEIRIGDVVWKDAEARFYTNWAFSFGDTRPLLGLAALNARGVHVEFDGDTCRLTVAG